jgi:signal transduction histidine kinase
MLFQMKKLFLLLALLFAFFSTTTAQTFTFSDTYPVNNTDSLIMHLAAHPNPSVERLRILIQLERSYSWLCTDCLGRHLAEIEQLNKQFGVPSVRGAMLFIQAILTGRTNQYLASQNRLAALEVFKTAHDTAGMIQVYAALSQNGILNMAQGTKSGSELPENYLNIANELLKKHPDVHGQLVIDFVTLILMYGQKDKSQLPEKFKNYLTQTSQRIDNQNGQLDYFSSMEQIQYQLVGDIEQAIKVIKNNLNQLKPYQATERLKFLFNLGTAYYYLKRYREAANQFEMGAKMIESDTFLTQKTFAAFFYNYRATMQELGDLKKADILADSALNHLRSEFAIENENNRLAFETQYQAVEKQKQIATLTLEKQQSDSRNQLVLILLTVAIVGLGLFGFLWLRLRRTNAQLERLTRAREQFFGIIAHDLRRPFHAFQELGAMVSYYIKKGDYEAVNNISNSIDEAGLKIRGLLDNLLKWALSQREEVPYKPEKLNLSAEIEAVLAVYRTAYIGRNIDFPVECATDLTVFVDRNALEMILRNLISNSLTAIVNDSGKIHIEATPQYQNQIRLTVSDNGKGLDTVKVNAFKQVLANPNEGEIGQNGFGFGLVLISKFAKRNGIKVDFESRVGEGTRFDLLLPPN